MNNRDIEKYRANVVGVAGGVVLEIGFGSGLNLPYYKNISRLYVVDPSSELYDLASERVKKFQFPIEYIQASAESIPLPDSVVDSVVSTWSLCSIPNPELAIKEILRVLKPGGKFSFVEHGKSPKSFIFKIQNLLTPISKRLAGGCHLNRDIEKMILDAGFVIQKIDKFKQLSKPLSFTYMGIAMVEK